MELRLDAAYDRNIPEFTMIRTQQRSYHKPPSATPAGECQIKTPMLWIGHDLKHPINVWRDLPSCPGVMVSAFQILRCQSFRRAALQKGLRSTLNFRGPVFIDSGGFLSQRSGRSGVDIDDLLELYRALAPDVAAVLDVPMHPLASNSSNFRRWQTTLANATYMGQRDQRLPLAPVLHTYNPAVVSRRSKQLKRVLPNHRVLCLGSLVPLFRASHIGERFVSRRSRSNHTIQRWRLIAALILRARHANPDTLLHIFGAGSLSTILLIFLLGADTSDSVAWRVKASYGQIQLPGLADRHISGRKNTKRTRRTLSRHEQALLDRCACPICDGKTLEQQVRSLAASYQNRAIHNVSVLLSEVRAFCDAMRASRQFDFVESRLVTSPAYRRIYEEVIRPALD